jgi:hypothetical protein
MSAESSMSVVVFVLPDFALTEKVYSPEFKIARHFHERASSAK